jgi:hypothetical protein
MYPDLADLHENAPYAPDLMFRLATKASVSEKVALGSHMGEIARYYSRKAIEWCNPEATREEIDMMLVAFLYGRELAEGFQAYLEKRRHRQKSG